MKISCLKILLLSTAIIFISACTFFDDTSGATSREEYLGWYCEADSDASDQWRCSRRLLSGALPIDKKPIAKSQSAEKNLIELMPKKIAEQPVEPIVNKSFETNFDISADGYTVQLGAYLSQAMAEQSAGSIITDAGQLIVHSIIVDGQYRFVIVCGQYQTRQQAQASAEHLTALNPQLEYWVRSIKSLRNSL